MKKKYTNKRVPEAVYNFESPGSGLKSWKPEYLDDKNIIRLINSTEVAVDIADYLTCKRDMRFFWKKELHYYSKKRGRIIPVNDVEKFLRKHVKKKLVKNLTDSVVAEFKRIMQEDARRRWCSKLEKRNRSVVLLKNCWFDIGRCYSETLSGGVVPGFQRCKLDVEMHEEPERPEEIDEIKLVIGEVVSGYVLNAPVKWCDIKTGETIEEMLRTAYPYTGPVAYMNACSSMMDDFAKVVADDVVAVMIDGVTLDTWTSAVRERVGLLVKAGIPTVIRADFLTIIPIGDETDCISKEITVVKRIDLPCPHTGQGQPEPCVQACKSQQGCARHRREEYRRHSWMAEGAWQGTGGADTGREIQTQPGTAEGDTEAGRWCAEAWHTDGDGQDNPAGDSPTDNANLRTAILGRKLWIPTGSEWSAGSTEDKGVCGTGV